MIGKKYPIQQQQIIDWIFKNNQIFGQAKGLFDSLEYDKFAKDMQKVLKQFRKQIRSQINHENIKLSKIGTLYRINQNGEQKIGIKYSVQFYHHFISAEETNANEAVDSGVCINYEKVAGESLLSLQFAKQGIYAYINSALQLARMKVDRKVYLNLGPATLSFYQSKVSILQATEKENKNVCKMQRLLSNEIKIFKERWDDAIEGCLFDRLNIRKIQDNFKKGAEVTTRFYKMQSNI